MSPFPISQFPSSPCHLPRGACGRSLGVISVRVLVERRGWNIRPYLYQLSSMSMKTIFFVWDHLLRWTPNTLHPDGQEVSESCIGEYFVAIVSSSRSWGNQQARLVGVTLSSTLFLQLIHVADIIWLFFLHLDMRLGLLHLIFTTWLYLQRMLRPFVLTLIEAWQP